ncbi:MAG: transcription factor [Clostridiaceae bacterium]|jgi:hypothetical protein|nr:transcription factor [Clostridiaceae bacterium]
MEQTLLSRKELADRWNLTTRTIIEYEQTGIIKRVPKIQATRYALRQIEEIENAGLELNPLSPVERRRLERCIEELEREIDMYKRKIENAKIALG